MGLRAALAAAGGAGASHGSPSCHGSAGPADARWGQGDREPGVDPSLSQGAPWSQETTAPTTAIQEWRACRYVTTYCRAEKAVTLEGLPHRTQRTHRTARIVRTDCEPHGRLDLRA